MPLVSGSIGEELAAEFLSWREAAGELPDMDDILAGKETTVPESANALYVVSSMIVQRVGPESSVELLDNVLNYLMRMPGEFSVMTLKELQRRRVLVEKSSVWKSWIREFGYLLA